MSLEEAIKQLFSECEKRNIMIATAESCTAGLITGALTEVAGSSAIVDRGFVTYSNEAKQEMLGVDAALIAQHGAVSEEVAIAMAEGALANSNAALTVSVTGIAGPGGGTEEKPVGLVHFACALEGEETITEHVVFDGDRTAVRKQAVEKAIDLMRLRLK